MSDPKRPATKTRRLHFALRAVVTLALLGLALSFVDLGMIGRIAADVAWSWLGVGFFLIAVIIFFESLQFAEVTRAFGYDIGTLKNLRMTVVGRFFALLTTAMLGTDIYRAMSMHSLGTGGRTSVSIAAVSRIFSLLALTPVLIAGLPFVAYYTWPSPRFWLFAAVVVAAVAATLLLLSSVGERVFPRIRWRFLRELAVEASQIRLTALTSKRRGHLWIFGMSQHVIRIFAIMAVAKAFGVTAGWTVFFAFVPVSLLLAMIPVSVGSWGLRELALVFSLGTAGVPAGPALLTSVTFGLLGMCFALVGGLIWATGLGAERVNADRDET